MTPADQAGRVFGGRRAALFASAAGVTGIVANLLLIGFYVLLVGRPEGGGSLGSANDLVGSLSTALMIPAAFALHEWLPDRRSTRVAQSIGIGSMAVLTVGGPLLVFGVLPFEVQLPIAATAVQLLAGWLLMVNRSLRRSPAFPPGVARFGQYCGGSMLAGALVVGLALLLPWMSVPQLILFGIAVPCVAGYLAIPLWFLFLGRHLAGTAPTSPSPLSTTTNGTGMRS